MFEKCKHSQLSQNFDAKIEKNHARLKKDNNLPAVNNNHNNSLIATM